MIEANLFKRSVYATSIMVALIFGLSLYSLTAFAAKHSQLPPTYDHWLNQEVNYLITNQERASFLALTTDKDRDSFIDTFWAIRNPDPNSPSNTYKDEHYRRLEYVNNHYGLPSAGNGWHTDRGGAGGRHRQSRRRRASCPLDAYGRVVQLQVLRQLVGH